MIFFLQTILIVLHIVQGCTVQKKIHLYVTYNLLVALLNGGH